MQNLIADIGYGFSKFMFNNQIAVMPSAVSRVRASQAFSEEDCFEFEGQKYLVGERAIRDAESIRDYSALEKYAPLLLFAGMVKLAVNPAAEITLSTGLSFSNWTRKEQFAERLADFTVNKTRINNINLRLTPQGKGVFLDCCSRDQSLTSKLCLVVDIGTYTINAMWFDCGRALAADSWANNNGTSKAILEVQAVVNREFGISSSEAEINKILQSGKITIAGDERDLSALINPIKLSYFDSVINQIRTRDHDLFARAEVIIFAGGGAELGNQLLPAGKQFIICPNPQLANLRGYATLLE